MFLKPLRVLFGLLGALLGLSWGLLGRSWAVLGRNWVVLGRLLGHLDLLLFFGTILGAKRVPKGRHFGSQGGAKIDKKRGADSRAKKSPLGVVLVRFWVDFQGVLGSKMMIFHCFLKVFVNINVFDKDECPRAI